MADNANISKIDAATEKAYAEAAANKNASAKTAGSAGKANASKGVKGKVKAAAPKASTAKPSTKPRKTVAAKKAAPKSAPKTAPKNSGPKKAIAAPKAARKPDVKKAAPKTAPAKTTPFNPVTELKEKIMASAKTTDFTATAKEMAADLQERAKVAFTKTGELASEVSEFNKGNVDAIVESGKIFVSGAQELAREDIENGKSALETATADIKQMAAVSNPTEFVQLQGELVRRNFDAAIAFGSKRTEALVKLYNDAFAPLSNRVSVAADKVKKAA